MVQILLVEDDSYLRKNLKKMLEENGFSVLEAAGRKEALIYIGRKSPIDLSLIDVMLPDGNGFEICTEIRKSLSQPIIFLTACDDEESVIKGLRLGADDYITKPFRKAELLARIQANLRRIQGAMLSDYLIVDNVRLDMNSNRIYIRDEVIELRPVEYEIIYILMQNHGMIVKREVFWDRLWELDGGVDDNTLSVHISRIRRKIGRSYIETIKGFGYRWRDRINDTVD